MKPNKTNKDIGQHKLGNCTKQTKKRYTTRKPYKTHQDIGQNKQEHLTTPLGNNTKRNRKANKTQQETKQNIREPEKTNKHIRQQKLGKCTKKRNLTKHNRKPSKSHQESERNKRRHGTTLIEYNTN